jgi:hypothetical protein
MMKVFDFELEWKYKRDAGVIKRVCILQQSAWQKLCALI